MSENEGDEEGRIAPGTVVLGIALIGVLAVGGWYLLTQLGDRQQSAEVPLVEAPTGPVRERPVDPGGRAIPNEDSTVFSLVETPDDEPVADRPPPRPAQPVGPVAEGEAEMPMEKPLAEPGDPPVASGDTEELLDGRSRLEVWNPDEPVPPADRAQPSPESEPVPEPEPKPRSGPETAPVAESVAESEPARETEPFAAPDAASSYRIQLGSLGTSEAARAEWQRLQQRYPDTLERLSLTVQRVDLGNRGVFFRIQAGPLDESAALSACDVIRESNPGGCLIVVP